MENDGVTANFTKCIITNTTAKNSAGGFIQIVKGLKLLVDKTSVIGSFSKDSQLMKIASSSSIVNMNVFITSSTFQCSTLFFEESNVLSALNIS